MVKIKEGSFGFTILTITILAFVSVAIGFYAPKIAIANPGVILKAGTPVNLRLTEEISSKVKDVGDIIHFEVVGDVKVDGKVVIKAGAPAEGEITIAEKQEMLGRPGKIAFMVRSTQAVDGTRAPLRATLTREGRDKETSALMLGLFICFLFLWKKGEPAVFPAGTEVRAYVDYDTEINI